jgi:LPXTG-motif cell wall-anchored protein
MNETIIQAGIWIAAGGLMLLFLKRRRSRRPTR